MPEKRSEHPAVKIAGVVGGIVLAIVFLLAVLAKEYLGIIGWIAIPLAIMGVALGFAANKKG